MAGYWAFTLLIVLVAIERLVVPRPSGFVAPVPCPRGSPHLTTGPGADTRALRSADVRGSAGP